MTPRSGPSVVVFTRHAEERVPERGIAPHDVADLILNHHHERRRNPGRADWVLAGSGFAVVYDWPGRGDTRTAIVVSVWRR